jgi:prepilin peptidase CpaA
MSAEVLIAVLLGIAATVEDLARREISNWIPVAALAGGLATQVATNGWMGPLYALGGAAAGFVVFLIFYWLGGMGGGDVKLMAGFGALLGPSRLLEAALWTAGVGGIIAIGVIGYCALRGVVLRARGKPEQLASGSIPYAPAITAGVWLALVPK